MSELLLPLLQLLAAVVCAAVARYVKRMLTSQGDTNAVLEVLAGNLRRLEGQLDALLASQALLVAAGEELRGRVARLEALAGLKTEISVAPAPTAAALPWAADAKGGRR